MPKVLQFFSEVKAELSKVVWPSRQQTIRYTLIVIGFSLVLSIILGATDLGLTTVLQKIINR